MNCLSRNYVCSVIIVVLALVAGMNAKAVDPRFPDEVEAYYSSSEHIELKPWLPARIRDLEAERNRLLQQIAGLPLHKPKPLPDHMGFHSLPWKEWDEDENQLIEVQFEFDPKLGAIALAPAFIPGEEGSYAFPKRFKIEVLDRGSRWVGGIDGKWVIPPPPHEWREVVNWMDEDFPDPGAYPVYFSIDDVGVYQLRMTIPRGASGSDVSYHALGELYLFRQPDEIERLGDNMMAWDSITLSASNTLSKPPIWDKTYLNDGVVGLGMPLSEEVSDAEDFMVSWHTPPAEDEPVQFILDLGHVRPVGRVQLWPAETPHGMAIPQFGFPGKVRAELSTSSDFSNAVEFVLDDIRQRMHTGNTANVITGAKKARYVRVTLEDLGRYHDQTILGLGEIRVSEYDEVWSLDCSISASGIPEKDMEQLPRLVDGFSGKRRILKEVEWIRGLAERRPLDRRLVRVELELELAIEAWSAFRLKASIWGGTLIGAGLLVAMGLQRLQRRHVLKTLKHRITRDLHDEVGSSLGSITLAARRMEKTGATEDDLADLSLMIREASAALKDVVWVIDQSDIRLPLLLQKLAERAQRVLNDVELMVDVGRDCPDQIVPLTFKRHLNMLFKEAVHNCALHANATKVWISLSADSDLLKIVVRDNGCGFDPDETGDGWGIDSMRKRAEELGGKIQVESSPGNGASIILTVPLSELRKNTDHLYKTSN